MALLPRGILEASAPRSVVGEGAEVELGCLGDLFDARFDRQRCIASGEDLEHAVDALGQGLEVIAALEHQRQATRTVLIDDLLLPLA